jgi:preprotein translocase subunit SecA
MYKKLAGMTGTAKTEEEEFVEIYNMNVVVIPTNKPVIRQDLDDSVYANQKAKFKAIVNEIVRRHETGQPLLVGTISVEKSEMLSEMLKKRGVQHNVLNAKQHMREAEIVAQAGRFGAVTIATNMAGRGTDIILGGHYDDPEEQKREHEKVLAVGGLHIIGTERHEARRIDNQLRGRSGRQGDPGSSQFFVALDDDLMRLFGGDRIQMIMDRFGLTDEPLEAGMLSKTIENAQKKVEGKNYGIRKYVLQYDDVMNRQRTIIYEERNRVLHGENLRDYIVSMMRDVAMDDEDYERLLRQYELKEKEIGEERMREVERVLLLRIVDTKWMDHIDAMDQLKTGIGLRSLGQQDPAQAYANEGFDMFEEMLNSIREDMVKYVLSITLETNAERKQVIHIGSASKEETKSSLDEGKPRRVSNMPKAAPSETKESRQTPVRVEKKPGRNDPCPCGSGKKYKNCHGKSV